MNNEFICPECGSKKPGDHMMVSRVPQILTHLIAILIIVEVL